MRNKAREPNEVIGMAKSNDEKWLAIVTGKNLANGYQRQNIINIWKIDFPEFIIYKKILVWKLDRF